MAQYKCSVCGTITNRPEMEVLSESEVLDITKFQQAMWKKLKTYLHKGGWSNMTPMDCWYRMEDEMVELLHAIDDGTPEEVMQEAADVANFAMMVAANYGRARKKD